MAGRKCPECGKDTLIITVSGEWCVKCGHISKDFTIPVGIRKKCPNCGTTGIGSGRCKEVWMHFMSKSTEYRYFTHG